MNQIQINFRFAVVEQELKSQVENLEEGIEDLKVVVPIIKVVNVPTNSIEMLLF